MAVVVSKNPALTSVDLDAFLKNGVLSCILYLYRNMGIYSCCSEDREKPDEKNLRVLGANRHTRILPD
ncbi:hypothetical protein FGG79_04550 [Bacillus sp. BHET2]|uniref:hypothetical protein n=1 Tax=Bacillus sp. BHET2 TaxID=2583818 RepID=UPI00110DBA36|nr:hypothetical protein [Bacillus sp. BHET2]TMU87401.1 hypothetical protein FGG79_04550 [Bacillus sp. BHET2]